MDALLFGFMGKVDPEKRKAAYRSVFTSPAGQVVLCDLCTRLKLVQKPENMGANAADARAFHDGERNVVLHIIRQVTSTDE